MKQFLARQARFFFASDEIDAVRNEILRRCNNLESGARLIDAVINNDLLPAVSVAFLQATMDGKEMKKFTLDVENGKFIHRIE